ncbi:MAG: hypothetical protein IJ243_08135 [Prevotella sp.]|nr:hypothetical protein [Prevotella sp.]
MKKFTLSVFIAALTVCSASAQSLTSQVLQPLPAFNPHKVAQVTSQLPGEQPKAAPSLISRAADASTIITETPEGTLYDQVMLSYGAYGRNWLYGIMDVSTDGGMGKIVDGADGNVYIYNLPTYLNAGSWVKAERAEGDTIVIHRQLIDQREGSDAVYDYYITKMVWEWTDEAAGEGRFVEAQGDTDMKLLYKDGVLNSIEANTDPFVEGSYALGAVYTTDNETFTWEGATNWNLHYEPLTDELVQLPDGAELETITVSYSDINGNNSAEQVKIAFVGNDVYLNVFQQGVYAKGTIEGDKLIFKSGQYLGSYYNTYYIFFVGERYKTVVDPSTGQEYQTAEIIDELVFDYNADDRSFKTDDALVINAGKTSPRLYLSALLAPSFYFFKEVPAIPANPQITNYNATYSQWGYNALQFTLSATDKDGNFIVPEKLTWMAYIDDEPFIFSPDDYEGLTEDMEEIPYGFIDSNYDIYTSYFTIFFEPAKNVGIQTIYRGGDKENRSDIVYYDLATSETYTEPFDNTTVGVAGVSAAQPATVAYHDAQGRRVAANAKGLVIKTVTQANGTSRSIKRFQK